MTQHRHWISVVLVALLASCHSGGNAAPTCSLDNPATAATASPWPKFRHDPQNTGAITDAGAYAGLATAAGSCRWAFPSLAGCGDGNVVTAAPKGPFSASAVINQDRTRLYIGSTDGMLYALHLAPDLAGTQDAGFQFTAAPFPISTTAAVALRNGSDAVFVGGGDGHLFGLDATGAAQADFWPFLFTAFASTSPVLGPDGTIYAAALDNTFFGVCPNGISRFGLSAIGLQSSPALAGTIVYFGADDGQLRSVGIDGIFQWAFATSAAILAAPVVELDQAGVTQAVYAADTGGLIFKVDAAGQPVAGFDFLQQSTEPSGCPRPPLQPIAASPALAGSHLYVASTDGYLYAVDTQSGAIAWCVSTGSAIVSSPAVAIDPGGASPIVTVGSSNGQVFFVRDDGQSAVTTAIFSVPLEGDAPVAVRSSPAIDADGTVYIGADTGRVYAIR